MHFRRGGIGYVNPARVKGQIGVAHRGGGGILIGSVLIPADKQVVVVPAQIGARDKLFFRNFGFVWRSAKGAVVGDDMPLCEGRRIIHPLETGNERQVMAGHGLRHGAGATFDKPPVKAVRCAIQIDDAGEGWKRDEIAFIKRFDGVICKPILFERICEGVVGERIGHSKAITFIEFGFDRDVVLAHDGIGLAPVLLPLDERVAVNGWLIEQLNGIAFG